MKDLSSAIKRIEELEAQLESLSARLEAIEVGDADGVVLEEGEGGLTDVEILHTVCEQLDGIEAHTDRVIRVHRDGKPSVAVTVSLGVVGRRNRTVSWTVTGQVNGAHPKSGNSGETLRRAAYILGHLQEPS